MQAYGIRLWLEPRGLRKGLFVGRRETPPRGGNYAKGVRAKFRDGVARSEQWVVLNFDLTPFASKGMGGGRSDAP